jgi:hypothetical protein
MFAEASTILRAVAVDFFFNCWYLEIPSDNRTVNMRESYTPTRLHGVVISTFYCRNSVTSIFRITTSALSRYTILGIDRARGSPPLLPEFKKKESKL